MTEPKRHFDIIIKGDGVVGKTLALALKRTLKTQIFVGLIGEGTVAQATQTDKRAFALGHGALSMLTTLGLIRHLNVPPTPIKAIEVLDHGLDDEARRPLLNFSDILKSDETDNTLGAIVESAALNQALISALDQQEITRFALDNPLAFEEQNNRMVFAENYSCRLLIAADGAESPLRSKVGLKTIEWDYKQNGLVARVAHEKPHHNVALQSFLPTGPFARLPLNGNLSSIVWSTSKAQAQALISEPLEVQEAEIKRRFGYELGAITLTEPLQSWPLKLMIARDIIHSRVALVGDAAHKIHPLAGLGYNLGLRDCAALTEIIANHTRLGLDIGMPNTLTLYQQWRRFDTVSTALTLDALNTLHSNANPALGFIRQTGMAILDRVPKLKQGLTDIASSTTANAPKLMRGELV